MTTATKQVVNEVLVSSSIFIGSRFENAEILFRRDLAALAHPPHETAEGVKGETQEEGKGDGEADEFFACEALKL